MADMTTPRVEQPGDATEINRRQTTDIPNGINGGPVGEGAEPNVRPFRDAENPQENPSLPTPARTSAVAARSLRVRSPPRSRGR
jgi:hypothetical protein